MSMSIPSVALSLLSSLSDTSSDPISSMINIINGGAASGTTQDPVSALVQAENNQAQNIKLQENDPETKAEIAHFTSVVNKSTTLQQVITDPIACKVLLTANGLASQAGYTALALKALSSDPSQSGNFASKLSNSAWTTMCKTYNFAKNGLSVLKQSGVMQSVTQGYAQVMWGQTADKSLPGLSMALDFRNRASTATSIDQVLSDPNFREVVSVAYGMPPQVALQPLDTQERAFSAHLDVKSLKDPKFVENLARQFLVNMQSSSNPWAGISI